MASKGKRKPSARELIGLWPSDKEQEAMLQASLYADGGHPIVVAMLGVALLEYELEKLLRGCFRRRDDNTWKLMTGEYGPLNTFSAKINAGYAFGLYDEVVRQALNTVRLIRNAFAHSKRIIDFGDERIIAEFCTIKLPGQKRSKLYKRLRRVRDAKPETGQQAYRDLCAILYLALLSRHVQRAKARNRNLNKRITNAAIRLQRSPLYNAFNSLAALPQQDVSTNALLRYSGLLSGGPTPPTNPPPNQATPAPPSARHTPGK